MNSIVNEQHHTTLHLAQSLARMANEFTKDYNQRVMHYLHDRGFTDVRPAHNAVFGNLGLDAVRVTELADRARVTQQAMGKMLKELEAMGYVRRAKDKRDKRAKTIELTTQGTKLVKAQLEAVRKVRLDYAERAGDKTVTALEQSLRTVLQNLHLSNMPKDWV